MHYLRAVFSVVLPVAGLNGAMAAQVPEAVVGFPTARLSALGGAGVALIAEPVGRSLNPALAASEPHLGLGVGYFRSQVSDISGIRAGGVARFGNWGWLSADLRQQHVDNLVDDPEFANDPSLTVSDWGIRVGYAKSFLGNRFRVGAAAERVTSRVFGTRGYGWVFDVGTAAQVTPVLSIGVSMLRTGSPFKWTTTTGETILSPLGQVLLVGVNWTALQVRGAALSLLLDDEIGLASGTEHSVRGGGELWIAHIVALRGGAAVSRRRSESGEWARMGSAGIGIALRGVRIDIARDRIAQEVGERTVVEVSIRR